MDKPIVSTLPVHQPKRKHIFAIRLTDTEHRQIEALARRLKPPPSGNSFMAAFHSRSCARANQFAVTGWTFLKVLRLTSETRGKETQPHSEQRIHLETVYRALLKIVARFDETTYTDPQQRQTTEVELDDLADPASERSTSQG